MPDGAMAAYGGAPRGDAADARLVRRVRWQLIGWSAGSTLVVLLVLGVAIYAAVATTLASASESLLHDRASLVLGQTAGATATPIGGGETIVEGGRGIIGGSPGIVGISGTATVVENAGLPGFAVGGPFSGTLAVVMPADAGIPAGPTTGESVDPVGLAIAATGGTTVRETTLSGAPVRVLSIPLPTPAGGGPGGGPGGVLQVVGDRTAELRTLSVLAAVLVGGGLAALAIAALLGSLYATRALVPIRASLRRQREFAADTSHELRTPLAVIRAGVARVRQQPDARVSEVAPVLEAVDEEAVRLGALVDDLLALARTDAGPADLDLRGVDLAEVAAAAMTALEPLAAKRGVHLALDVEPAPMRGDEERLRRLVTVLVDNAIRHGHEGGHVLVTVRAGSLVVEDDGPGIPAAERGRVFERFWRGADAAPGGSGLGLAIAAWIADRHDGRISVGESALGGARFRVTLPGSAHFTMSS
jgi:signal transduction histidine kinase